MYANNAHWLNDNDDSDSDSDDDDDDDNVVKRGGPSRWVAYYDAASLYPSSGE